MSEGIHSFPEGPLASPAEREPIPPHYAEAPPPDPNVLAMPIFIVASVALGLSLVGYIPSAAQGGLVPLAWAATGLGLFFVCIWSAWLRRSFDAAVSGFFATFWFSYAILSLGLAHNWFNVPAGDVNSVNKLFMLSFAIPFALLVIGSVRTTIVFTAFLGVVEAAVVLILANDYVQSSTLADAAGAVVFLFCTIGAYIFLASTQAVFGYRSVPMGKPLPLGKPLAGTGRVGTSGHDSLAA